MKSHAVAEPSPVTTAKRSAAAVRSSRAGLVQTKLAIGSPGDAYEHEADRAADAAVRASSNRPARPIALDVTPLVQRAPAEPKKDDEKRVQKKAADSSTHSITLDAAPLVQRAPAEPKKDDEKVVQKKAADSSTHSIALDAAPLVQRAPAEPKKDDEKVVQKKAADSSTPSFDAGAATLVQRARASPHKKDSDDDEKFAQKKAADPATEGSLETLGVPARVEAQIGAMSSGGESLPRAERAFFEDRFGYNFRDVRVHAGAGAAQAASALNARAFTVGQNIFFGSGEYQPGSAAGRHLVAHELTHTIQQSPPAARAARMVQRDLTDDAKAWAIGKVHDWAVEVPGYKLMTGLIGNDPITDAPVTVTGEELIHEGLVEFVPDGEAIFQKLQADKTITQFLDYFHQQWALLNLSWETIKTLFRQVWDDLGALDLVDPAGAWEKIKARFGPPLERLTTFIVNVGGYIIDVIKKKVLEWLRDWGTKIPGYPLLTFILGKDPFTDEPVPRTPTNFVKAVLSLVPGGDKIFENLQKSHTIERTVEWLNQEIVKLDLTWEKIKALFSKAWDVISTSDLLDPIGFVDKIREIFEAPAIRVVNFAIDVGKKVLEFIFEGVMMLAGPLGQRVVGIFQTASASFSKIVADPVAFLGHLVDAVVLGFKQFVAKIGEYLEAGVIAWLTGALQGAGITLPKVWDLKGILSLVLQILGITYAKMRAKVVKALGENGEKIVSTAERVWGFLVALVTEGPAAAWQKISEALGNLWTLVIGGIKNWAIVKIIKTAVTQLVTLFNPVGAVIEAIIETYRTIEFFVKKINQIVDLVEAIVNSIANIAAGQIAAAANFVEKTLARTIPVIIGFLASLIGLDDISEGIRDTIEALQQKVDQAIDAAIDWVVKQVKALFGKDEEDKKGDGDGEVVVEQDLSMEGESHSVTAKADAGSLVITLASPQSDRLQSKIATAIDKVAAGSRPDKDQVVSDLKNAHKLADENEIITEWKAQGNGDIPVSAEFASQHVATIVNQLISFSKLYQVHELEDLWKGVPDQRYLPASYRGEGQVRDKLYLQLLSPGWDTIAAGIRTQQLPKIIEDVGDAWSLKDSAPPVAKTKWDALVETGVVRDDLPMYGADYARTVEYAVDHEPPLAKHWVQTGHDSPDEDRLAEASGESSVLTLVTKRFNSQKGGGGFNFLQVPWVGPNFRHKDAQDNAAGALLIGGDRFVDATGKPLF